MSAPTKSALQAVFDDVIKRINAATSQRQIDDIVKKSLQWADQAGAWGNFKQAVADYGTERRNQITSAMQEAVTAVAGHVKPRSSRGGALGEDVARQREEAMRTLRQNAAYQGVDPSAYAAEFADVNQAADRRLQSLINQAIGGVNPRQIAQQMSGAIASGKFSGLDDALRAMRSTVDQRVRARDAALPASLGDLFSQITSRRTVRATGPAVGAPVAYAGGVAGQPGMLDEQDNQFAAYNSGGSFNGRT